jgi:acetoin utilization deacetylase AcuC-like enzyme
LESALVRAASDGRLGYYALSAETAISNGEGGYAVEEIGINAVNVLQGCEER